MEKKTMGSFIAALRKANGMTQKDLAERLNVSDKTVSRWERDDGAPDLSVIPAIAEVFGVTCDELLRGERKSPAERAEMQNDRETSAKGEKRRQRLLKSSMSQYRNLTYIAMGVSVVGMIAALICNLAFLEAVLGFLMGAIFFVASIVCQSVFVNRAFLSVEDAELDAALISGYKRNVISLAQKSVGLTVAFIGFTSPLAAVDSYLGLTFESMLIYGSMGAAAFLLAYAVVLYFLNARLLKKGVYSLSDKEIEAYRHNHKLQRACAIVLVVVLAVTAVGHQFATSIWGPFTIMEGATFEDYDSFVEYMEQDIPASPQHFFYGGTTSVEQAAPSEETGTIVYYDEAGNEISEEEALTRRLEDRNGNVVCEYVDRNESVVSLQYTPGDGTILPITVFTQDVYQEARQIASVRHAVFGALYCIECLAAVLVYFRKRAK